MTQKIPSELIADDAITLAKMAGGTDGNIISYDASGNPVAIATGDEGEILTSAGEGAPPAFAAAAAGGGITQADSWELTSQFAGDATPIDNLQQVSGPPRSAGFGVLGDSMSEDTGVFTFPETGFWQVMAMFNFRHDGNSFYCRGFISVTTNNADWNNAVEGSTAITQYSDKTMRKSLFLCHLMDVTDVANVKVRFTVDVYDADVATYSDSGNQTSFHFIRLADL